MVVITWLGQAGFLLRSGEATVLIDACLTAYEGRRYPPPVDPATLSDVDIVLCTHEHWDHLDAPTVAAVAAVSPGARIVVPLPIVDQAVAAGVPADRVVGAVPDEPITDLGAPVFPLPARHGVDVADAYTFGLVEGETRYLGYVVELGGARVYHAGDTVWWPGQEEALRRLGVHVALLPINGRDQVREADNIVGNLDHREAAWIAHRAGVDLLVPMHWDMFDGNRGFPDQVIATVERLDLDVSVLVPRRMHPFRYLPPAS
ncbi:MAG TPA: MBL fold metallo-hydrolase [Micromonosporaceae bacterium]|nr:MBL fold metallo-hydrolase [Micromonosporaceae bacterium]